jgi:hypothetical protein
MGVLVILLLIIVIILICQISWSNQNFEDTLIIINQSFERLETINEHLEGIKSYLRVINYEFEAKEKERRELEKEREKYFF